ncbi:MAG: type II toxin-antitoxin system VapC family toxin [Burkholderiaceae bacterium]
MAVYVDTSALIKRYVHESASARFDEFLAGESVLVISPLGLTEFESMLQRRLRQGEFDQPYLDRSRDFLGRDIESALWQLQPFDPTVIPHATRLIRDLGTTLATLDAIHIACAQSFGCDGVATGDRQFARAAQRCGLAIFDFSD